MPALAEAEAIEAEVRAAIAAVRARAAAFGAGRGGEPAAVLREFDRLTLPLNGPEGRASLFVMVHPDAALRARCEGLERELAELRTDLALDRGLYERLAALEPATLPDAPARRLLARALADFRRSGVDRDEPTRARVRALQEELVALGQEFDRNLVALGRRYTVPDGAAGLAGLPPDFLAAHPPGPDGALVLTTDPHVRLAVLTYAERGDVRHGFYLAAMNRAFPENVAVLAQLLARRHELARLLGHAHWADLATEDKMTRTAAAARAFLARVRERLAPRARADYAELLARKRLAEPAAAAVHEWERAFWAERVKSERFGFDSLAVRAYFPFERVRDGVLATAARLFGLEFRRAPAAPLWHPSVQAWEVREGGALRGRFHLDLHPREGKFKHAAMLPLQDGLADEALPEAVLLCNFPAPGPGEPALLLFDQVTTFFHEFGHLLHHVLAGRGQYLLQAGIATERDFVEVPSQLFEEWAWDAEVLASFAHHVETDEPIPAELVARLAAAEDHGKGLALETQVFFGLLALDYHERDPAGRDLTADMIALKQRLCVLPHTPGAHFHASFGHLHGYSALYYTYLWSLVIAKDCRAAFGPRLCEPGAALRFRRAVLEPGGARDAGELVRAFLGREHDFVAFERWLAE